MAVVSDVSRAKALEMLPPLLKRVVSFEFPSRVLDAEIIFVFATSIGCFAGALSPPNRRWFFFFLHTAPFK
jgi:hypothetical protein